MTVVDRRFQSQVLFRSTYPKVPELGEPGESTVLVHDEVLLAAEPGFAAWSGRFSLRFAVKAGEELKELSSFGRFIEELAARSADVPGPKLTLVAAGGGSVGDFTGFVASVYKRGVRLVHFPSTWLSAIDSSHGGKTALNLGRIKNQIGTFYPADRVYLVKRLLWGQPPDRAREAFGELAKIALIDGRAWVRELRRSRLRGGELLWKFLPPAIDSKYRVVLRDPFESRKVRQALNLGHTLGHVLEAHHRLAHGVAVAQGMVFAVDWSARRGYLKPRATEEIRSWLEEQFGIRSRAGELAPIPRQEFLRLLRQDKKRDSAASVLFVFLRAIGEPRLEQVTLADLEREAMRQGWVSGESAS